MRCDHCGSLLDSSGLFPGASLVCACGTTNLVALEPPRDSGGPYRSAAVAPSAPGDAAPPHDLRGATHGDGPCPRCQRPLEQASARAEIVSACGRCRGAFVEHDVLARMIEAAHAGAETGSSGVRPAEERETHYLRCPRCAEVMRRMSFGRRSGIIVDACAIHGTWFDAGELDAVLALVAYRGLAALDASDAPGERSHEEGEAARLGRVAQSLLREEAMRDDARVRAATDVVEDLLLLVFPATRSWPRRVGR